MARKRIFLWKIRPPTGVTIPGTAFALRLSALREPRWEGSRYRCRNGTAITTPDTQTSRSGVGSFEQGINMFKKTIESALLMVTMGFIFIGSAEATTTSFQFSSGSRSAQVQFTASGNLLTVQLTNTSMADVLVPADVLTAVFFTLAGNPTLTPISAIVVPGSVVHGDPAHPYPGPTDVGGEWAYHAPLNAHGAQQGISSVGLGLFGPADRFDPSSNLQGPASPNGLQYGISSAGDDPNTGNGGVMGNGLIRNSVSFLLEGLPLNFNLGFGVSHIVFQYGTDLSEPSFPGTPPRTPFFPPLEDQDTDPAVPEPVTALSTLLSMGALAAAGLRRRVKA